MNSKIYDQVEVFYNDFTLHVCPGPRSANYLIPFVALPLILVISPSALPLAQVRFFILPTIYAFQIHVWISEASFDVISMNHCLMLFMLLGWYDVRNDFKSVYRTSISRTTGDQSRGSSISSIPSSILEPYPDAFFPRLCWIFNLMTSLRLTDWHIGNPSHDVYQPSSTQPFTSFFLSTLTNSIFLYVLLCFTYSFISDSSTFIPLPTTSHQSPIIDSLIALIHLYASIRLLTSTLPTLLCLLPLAISPQLRHNPLISPLTWPRHFGSPASIWSLPPTTPTTTHTKTNTSTTTPPPRRTAPGLRAFWSQFWHQNMRHLTTTPGLALCHLLRLSTPSLTRYIVIVTTSFFFSGLVHMGVIPPYPLHTSWTVTELRVSLAMFFWVQPLGIGVEVVVQRWIVAMYMGANKGGQEEEQRQWWWLTSWRRVMLQIGIVGWTIGFLAVSAWFTIVPVGREMRWWGMGETVFGWRGNDIQKT